MLLREFFQNGPRPVTAVLDRDTAYTEAFFGASFARIEKGSEVATLSAAILGSSLAAWFFWLTASEFGVHKRRLLVRDVDSVPVPNLTNAVRSPKGKRVLAAARALQREESSNELLSELDEAVAE